MLSRTCRRFRVLFESTPCLHSTVMIRHDMKSSDLPAMLKWLHEHGKAVETLVAQRCSPWLDMILGSLLSTSLYVGVHTYLTKAFLCNIAATTLEALCHFDRLATIALELAHPDQGSDIPGPQVDLDPLQGLPHLTSLLLAHGQFVHLETLSHLTSLAVVYSEVDCKEDCPFVTSLGRLVMLCSHLRGLHTNGVPACCDLTRLHLYNAAVQGANADEDMVLQHDKQYLVSNSLSNLTALAVLNLDLFGSTGVHEVHVQLPWLGQLTSLQEVTLHAGTYHLELSESFTRLQQLTKLVVTAFKFAGQIKVCFNWAGLVALEEVFIKGLVTFCQGVLELVQLKALSYVEFWEQGNLHTDSQIELLFYRLYETRPNVMVKYHCDTPGP